MKINVADVVSESIVDGKGFRFAVFCQGCIHECEGCHNPQTWPLVTKNLYEPEELLAMALASPFNQGVTLTGGEPLLQARALIPFAEMVRDAGLDLWVYSGFTFEEIMSSPDGRRLLDLTDVLVDGRFVKELASYELRWRGSSNQRVIDLVHLRGGRLCSFS